MKRILGITSLILLALFTVARGVQTPGTGSIIGGVCSAGQVVNAIDTTGIPTCGAPVASSPTIIGTALFDPSGGSIASLVTTGIVSGVTYSSTGHYVVNFSSSQTNYLTFGTFSDGSNVAFVFPLTIGSTSVTMQVCNANCGAFINPSKIMVQIVK